MKIKPSAADAVRVTAYSAASGRSKSMTVYECTPDELIDRLRKLIEDSEPNEVKPAPQS